MQLADFGHNFQPGCATIYVHISWLQQLNQNSDTVTSQALPATPNRLAFNGLRTKPKNPASATKQESSTLSRAFFVFNQTTLAPPCSSRRGLKTNIPIVGAIALDNRI